MPKKVPYLREELIESDAAALLAEFAQARGIVVKPPIPIEDIVEKHLKLGLDFDDTHRLFKIPRLHTGQTDILGALFFEERRIVIDEGLDPDAHPEQEGRYRYTLGHEAGGHWRLHRHLFVRDPGQMSLVGGDEPLVVCRSSNAKASIEWQADYYSSCLLMPKNLVLNAWQARFGSVEPFVFDADRDRPMSSYRGGRPQTAWERPSQIAETGG